MDPFASIYVFVNVSNMTDSLKCNATKLSMKFTETVSFTQFLHYIFINEGAYGIFVLFILQSEVFFYDNPVPLNILILLFNTDRNKDVMLKKKVSVAHRTT